jgi:hypothetical protein
VKESLPLESWKKMYRGDRFQIVPAAQALRLAPDVNVSGSFAGFRRIWSFGHLFGIF